MDDPMPLENLHYKTRLDLIALAQSLSGQMILGAFLVEEEDVSAGVVLRLGDGRHIKIGAYGALNDEAYLIFREMEECR